MKHLFLISLILLGTQSNLLARPPAPESVVSKELRLESADKHLHNQTNQIAVYTKGLVCASCGIGLRVHISKLDGIDTKQLDDGMQLDVKHQLMLIAFKPEHALDANAVYKAIVKAGYDATHYYQWNGKATKLHTFTEAK